MTVHDMLKAYGLTEELEVPEGYDKGTYLEACREFLKDVSDKHLCQLSRKQQEWFIDIAENFSNPQRLTKVSKGEWSYKPKGN